VTRTAQELQRPPSLSPGDRIALVAPAAPYDTDELQRGVERLRSLGFEAGYGREHRPPGHLVTATVRERLEELHDAFADPDVAAVMAIRGGYGVLPLLDGIDWELLAAHPKLLMGLSDITPLLNGMVDRSGVTSLHGPVAVGLGGRVDDESVDRLVRAMTADGDLEPLSADGSVEDWCLSPGAARGRVCGGNLSMIAATLGTPFQVRADGCILLLEDVGEPPYRIHRLLTQLRLAGVLDRCAGIGLGELVGCDPPDGVVYSLRDVVRDVFADLPLPVLWGLPFGHGSRCHAFPIGACAVLDATRGTVTFSEPAVQPRGGS